MRLTRELSRAIDRVTAACSHPLASVVSVLIVVVVLVVGAWSGFSALWNQVMGAATGLLSIVLLFVLTHSTSKGDLALQVKLDALLFAVQEAQNDLAGLEEEEEGAIRTAQLRLREEIKNQDML